MGLGGIRWLSGDGQSRNGTHHLLLTTRILRPFQQVGMDVGNSGAGVRSLILDVVSDGMGVHDIVASGGDGCVRVFATSLCNLKLSTRICSNDRTHVKHLENSVKVRLPSGDLPSAVHRVESSGERSPFTPLC